MVKKQMTDNEPQKHFTASALIVKDRKVLLIYHKKLNIWLHPGGHIENTENPDEALIREVKEETGLDIEIIGERDNDLADIKTDVSVLHNPYVILCEWVGNHYHNDMVYLCRIVGNNDILQYSPSESRGIKFFGVEDLDSINLFPNFRRLLLKVLGK